MAITMPLATALDAAATQIGPVASAAPPVPTTRSVPSLDSALRDVQRLGGTVTSETRTAPGIGSWAFVADATGMELVLWEDAPAMRP
jgi:predicted enzyme related to lactoylglutathione lyase